MPQLLKADDFRARFVLRSRALVIICRTHRIANSATFQILGFASDRAVSGDGTPIIDPAKGLKTVEQGAATQVWCATSPKLAGLGGVYCEDCDIAQLQHTQGEGSVSAKAGPGRAGVWSHAVDREAAARLWSVSEQMLGL